MVSAKKRGLGKGLGALIPGALEPSAEEMGKVEPGAQGTQILFLDPHIVDPNPKQPRMNFSEELLQELAESIRRDGVQEPVIVRRAGDRYQLVSGERRVRACIMAGLDAIPAICREVSDADMLKLGLIENIQREDLNAIELANAYQRLLTEFGWTQEELAAQVGKNRVTVTNTLRLLNLPPEVQQRVVDASITMGHARALLAFGSAAAQSAACRKIIEQGLSVRQAERLAAPPKPRAPKSATKKDPNIAQVEDELRRALGTKVSVRATGPQRGKIEIEYFTLDDLERILDVVRRKR